MNARLTNALCPTCRDRANACSQARIQALGQLLVWMEYQSCDGPMPEVEFNDVRCVLEPEAPTGRCRHCHDADGLFDVRHVLVPTGLTRWFPYGPDYQPDQRPGVLETVYCRACGYAA